MHVIPCCHEDDFILKQSLCSIVTIRFYFQCFTITGSPSEKVCRFTIWQRVYIDDYAVDLYVARYAPVVSVHTKLVGFLLHEAKVKNKI